MSHAVCTIHFSLIIYKFACVSVCDKKINICDKRECLQQNQSSSGTAFLQGSC